MTHSTHRNILVGDWGGENFRSAIVTESDRGLELIEQTYSSVKTSPDDTATKVIQTTIDATGRAFEEQVHGAGIAYAGPIDNQEVVLASPNIMHLREQTPHNLSKTAGRILGVRTVIANDIQAALAGEVAAGGLKGKRWAMLENIGTGWGGARLFNGVAVPAEPGHKWLPNINNPLCGCGKTECAEAQFGGGNARRSLIDLLDRLNIDIPEDMDPCAFADQEALKGEQWAIDFYTNIAHSIGNIWGSSLNDCPPMEDIVHMGTFLNSCMKLELFRQKTREAMLARSMFPDRHASIEFKPLSAPVHNETGDTLGPLIGAAKVFGDTVR